MGIIKEKLDEIMAPSKKANMSSQVEIKNKLISFFREFGPARPAAISELINETPSNIQTTLLRFPVQFVRVAFGTYNLRELDPEPGYPQAEISIKHLKKLGRRDLLPQKLPASNPDVLVPAQTPWPPPPPPLPIETKALENGILRSDYEVMIKTYIEELRKVQEERLVQAETDLRAFFTSLQATAINH